MEASWSLSVETIGTHHDYACAILHFKTAHSAVRFCVQHVCKAQYGGQENHRLAQRKLIRPQNLVIRTGQRAPVETRNQGDKFKISLRPSAGRRNSANHPKGLFVVGFSLLEVTHFLKQRSRTENPAFFNS